ncbi:MAG: integration host factor subunit beta [Candidatus Omnitrophica bacterium]|nr:integration host factor subunit beta [Candidatus Omnitrophota bacterium]MDD5080839.1 integration host factor subunit beta [Candidatus Omnitrophota bacterium]MDD5441649.1 integration host factor subunit beta [Candidatus Omnitrophota bacterium]
MNKVELVEKVAELTETKKQAQEIVETILASIKGALKKKEDVAIAGFGAFKVKKVKAKTARNPKTGEAIKVPAKNKVTWKPSKEVKELVN